MKRPIVLLSLLAVMALGAVATAGADALGPITFEPTAYTVGNINGQNGWVKTGAYDAAVVANASFPAAAGYGFGHAVAADLELRDQRLVRRPDLRAAARQRGRRVDEQQPLRGELLDRHRSRHAAARSRAVGQPRQRSGWPHELPALRGSGRRRPRLLRRRHRQRPGRHHGDLQRARHRDALAHPGTHGALRDRLQARRRQRRREGLDRRRPQGDRHLVGELLPLRPGADPDRQRRPADPHAALP